MRRSEVKNREKLEELGVLTYDELLDLENRKHWKDAYLVKPYQEVDYLAKVRDQNKPGFPYISFKGSETLKMAYALRLLTRQNVREALFNSPDRDANGESSQSVKLMVTLTNKGYLERFSKGTYGEYLYTLGEKGASFLGVNGDNSIINERYFYDINQAFNRFAEEYRQDYRMEWMTAPAFGRAYDIAAAMILWDKSIKTGEVRLFVKLKEVTLSRQIDEIVKKQEELAEAFKAGNMEEAVLNGVLPDVYVLPPIEDMVDKEPLKILDNGRSWAAEGMVDEWLRSFYM